MGSALIGRTPNQKGKFPFPPWINLIFFPPQKQFSPYFALTYFSLCVKVRYPPSIQVKLYFITVECDVSKLNRNRPSFCSFQKAPVVQLKNSGHHKKKFLSMLNMSSFLGLSQMTALFF